MVGCTSAAGPGATDSPAPADTRAAGDTADTDTDTGTAPVEVSCGTSPDHPLDDVTHLWSVGVTALGVTLPAPGTTCPEHHVDGAVDTITGDCADASGWVYTGSLTVTTVAEGTLAVVADDFAWTGMDGRETRWRGRLEQVTAGSSTTWTADGWQHLGFDWAGLEDDFCYASGSLTSLVGEPYPFAADVVVTEGGVGTAHVTGSETFPTTCAFGPVDTSFTFEGARTVTLTNDTSCTGCGVWTASDGTSGTTCPWAD